MQIRFLKSATALQDCPQDEIPEVAILGRSNAGKSSLLNALANQKNLASVSAAPGKTRLINFFNVENKLRFVDLPGYGYAVRSKSERGDWQGMIETFLSTRGNLRGALLLMDIRRDWSEDEANLVTWNQSISLPVLLVLTKVDKLGRADTEKRVRTIREDLKRISQLSPSVYVVSSTKKTGLLDLEKAIFKSFLKN